MDTWTSLLSRQRSMWRAGWQINMVMHLLEETMVRCPSNTGVIGTNSWCAFSIIHLGWWAVMSNDCAYIFSLSNQRGAWLSYTKWVWWPTRRVGPGVTCEDSFSTTHTLKYLSCRNWCVYTWRFTYSLWNLSLKPFSRILLSCGGRDRNLSLRCQSHRMSLQVVGEVIGYRVDCKAIVLHDNAVSLRLQQCLALKRLPR